MKWFESLAKVRPADRLVDVGGHGAFWIDSTCNLQITLLNLDAEAAGAAAKPGSTYVSGDACRLPFADGSFEVAFSNSVIEHVGSWERQKAFACEIRRIAGCVWVQTPAREFFIEPHLLFPCIHWFPPRLQAWLIPWLTPGGWIQGWDAARAKTFLQEVRLLTHEEMKTLFPDCVILRERFCGLTKSYVAFRMRESRV